MCLSLEWRVTGHAAVEGRRGGGGEKMLILREKERWYMYVLEEERE